MGKLCVWVATICTVGRWNVCVCFGCANVKRKSALNPFKDADLTKNADLVRWTMIRRSFFFNPKLVIYYAKHPVEKIFADSSTRTSYTTPYIFFIRFIDTLSCLLALLSHIRFVLFHSSPSRIKFSQKRAHTRRAFAQLPLYGHFAYYTFKLQHSNMNRNIIWHNGHNRVFIVVHFIRTMALRTTRIVKYKNMAEYTYTSANRFFGVVPRSTHR